MSISIRSTASTDIDNRLCTVKAVQDDLELSTTESTALINSMIKRASDLIENVTNREISFQELAVSESRPGRNNHYMLLTQRPVVEITKADIDGDTIGSTTFEIDNARAGLVFRPSRWSETLLTPHHIEPIRTNIGERLWNFEYKGGYVLPNSPAYDSSTNKLPHDLEFACIQTVKTWFLERRSNPNVRREEIGDAAISRFSPRDVKFSVFPPSVTSILDLYVDLAPLE